ncbi:WD40-repeat-containing domain protein [Chiua virens]|nr:WD40-repeat-containing domain protein [Chiua virens]
MNIDNPAQLPDHPSANTITIRDIEIRTQEQRKVSRQYVVQFSVNGILKSTRRAKEENNRVSWGEILHFYGDDRSVFEVKVYQKRRGIRDKLVGFIPSSNTIGGVLESLQDGVFEQTLLKDTSSNEWDLSRITIKFTLTADFLPKGSDGSHLQNTDDVTRLTELVTGITLASGAARPIDSTLDVGTIISAKARMFKDMWGVFLKRVELLGNIVVNIEEIHPFASLAWSVMSAVDKVFLNQKPRHDRIVHLIGTMNDVFAFVHDAEPLKKIELQIGTMLLLVQQVTECGFFIAEEQNFWIRTEWDIADKKITAYELKLQELKTAFLEGVTLQAGLTVVRMINVREPIAETTDLSNGPYGAKYTQEKQCHPGTREVLLQEICDILNDPDPHAPRVCLLTGVAGSGKSAVAHSIARLYDGQERLGSLYCFSRIDVTKQNPRNFFSTITRDLCDRDPHYKSALCGTQGEDPLFLAMTTPSEPRENFHAIGPIVIVVDTLDESGDRDDRQQFLATLSKWVRGPNLPTGLRFLITARTESDILAAFPSGRYVTHKHMSDISDEIVDKDIETFIYHSLRHPEPASTWPDHEECRLLAQHSQHLFQWAATACKFIQGIGVVRLDPSKRFEIVMQNATRAVRHHLDELYGCILGQLLSTDDARESFRELMTIVLSLKEPLPFDSLSALFSADKFLNIRDVMKPMGSLLDVLDENKPIRPLHTSLCDFLLDETRSYMFHVPIQPQDSLALGRVLLACMRKMLKFNICDLKDSRLLNNAVPDLSSQVTKAIPLHLSYSCQYWMDHFAHVHCAPGLLDEVTLFFKTYLPYWLEAISLLSHSSPLSTILAALKTCTTLMTWAKDQEIAALASDACRFIQVFAPILQASTPHLYLSAMPQTPTVSPLYALWQSRLLMHASTTSGQLSSWPVEVCILQGHRNSVQCVAYSPDGRHIVTGSWDHTIMVWDAATGETVAGPFEGHTHVVLSVACSPDGRHIASGSGDETVRVWDATTGKTVANPSKGHRDSVMSVAYSPDGTHIVSGSEDNTVRVWNATTGETVAGPFKGHKGSVQSVAYAPNGTHIVSGSVDKTIRVWNATTGETVAGSFNEHTNSVSCVAYSPDGKCIVSGSSDKTIRVWNAISGRSVAGPFHGHTEPITSVAYSPDGSHIVSGSWDKTIRVWNATTGGAVTGPFVGHTDVVWSVGYSSDGRHVVSGSGDKTIRVWDGTASHNVAREGPFYGHKDSVCSVTYSQDGRHIVSGSKDKTIRVWDVTIGLTVAGPFEGHTDLVTSVACSPDGIHVASASADKTIRIWDLMSGQSVGNPFKGHTGHILSIAYSPDGKHIISGSQDKTVRIWNTETGQFLSLIGHLGWVISIAFSSDGMHIVSGSEDKSVRIWTITGTCVAGPLKGHVDSVTSVAYSPDGMHVASGSWDKTIRVWNVGTGRPITKLLRGHTDPISCITYISHGKHIISGSFDKTIRVWNATSGECVAGPFLIHSSPITSISYSPGEVYIVSCAWDKTIKVCTTFTGKFTMVAFLIPKNAEDVYALSGLMSVPRIWNDITGQCLINQLQEYPFICFLFPR